MTQIALVSGASGFLGRRLCEGLQAAGWSVRALVRRPGESFAVGKVFLCDLPHHIDPAAFVWPQGSDVVCVHCAYATQSSSNVDATAVNLEGTRRLRREAEASGARFVFISSMAAHPAARSLYGRSKFLLETELDAQRDLIIKPGTIVGPGGLFGRVQTLAKRLPMVPVFYAQSRLQIVALDDVAHAITTAIAQRMTGTLALAHPDPITVEAFYRGVCGDQAKLFSAPGDLALALARGAEACGLKLPLTSDNLLGLKHGTTFKTTEDWRKLGLTPIDFSAALRRSSEGRQHAVESESGT